MTLWATPPVTVRMRYPKPDTWFRHDQIDSVNQRMQRGRDNGIGPSNWRRYKADAIAAWMPRMFAPLLSTFWIGSARPEIQILRSESMSKVPAFSIE
jgi:hypothetical protein